MVATAGGGGPGPSSVAWCSGGPGFASETLNVYTFQVGLFYFHIGYACSLLVILFALVLGVSLLLIKVRRGSW